MTPDEIILFARGKTGATVDEISNQDAFLYLNNKYRKLWEEIALLDKNYGLKKWTTNIVQDVNEYDLLLPIQSPKASGQMKIDNVLIKYNSTSKYYSRAENIDWNNIQQDPAILEDTASNTSPLYIVDQNRIVIFPKPKVSVGDGLVIYANQRPYDLISGMLASDILLEVEYHDVLGYDIMIDFYQKRQRADLVEMTRKDFEVEKQKMMRNIKRRVTRPIKGIPSDFSIYTKRG